MVEFDPYKILEYPLSTEKAVRQMEAENCLIFIVNKESSKGQIKWATEKAFGVKVQKVRTLLDPKGRRKAYIKLKPETPASEVTTALGLV